MDRERFRKPSAHNGRDQQTVGRQQPTLLDDDDDIFALWQSQKQIQIQRLAEEAAKRELKRARKQLAQAERRNGQSSRQTTGKEIAISLALPEVSLPTLEDIRKSSVMQWVRRHRKGVVLGIGGVTAMFAIGWVPRLVIQHTPAQPNASSQAVAKPDFKTVAPSTGTAVAP